MYRRRSESRTVFRPVPPQPPDGRSRNKNTRQRRKYNVGPSGSAAGSSEPHVCCCCYCCYCWSISDSEIVSVSTRLPRAYDVSRSRPRPSSYGTAKSVQEQPWFQNVLSGRTTSVPNRNIRLEWIEKNNYIFYVFHHLRVECTQTDWKIDIYFFFTFTIQYYSLQSVPTAIAYMTDMS